MSKLADGLYSLPTELKNPKKLDRRFKNWVNQETFKAGGRFEVKTHQSGVVRDGVPMEYQTIKKLGTYDSVSVATAPLLFEALVAALVKEPETLGSVLREADISVDADRTQAVIGFLLDNGKITLQDVKDALQQEQAIDEGPWREHLHKHGLRS